MERKYNLEITADERDILIYALASRIAAGQVPGGPWSTLARRLIDLSCQPSSSMQPAAPETTSPTVAPTRAPAAQTRGKVDTGARGSSQTLEQLSAAGYKLLAGGPAFCRACGKTIEWWETPNGKKTPFDVHVDHGRVSHFATCPKADEFRK